MKYKITASATSNRTLCQEYPCLKDFNHSLVTPDELKQYGVYENYIEINTLGELHKLKTAVEYPLIFDGKEIEIYDGWRE